MLTKSRYIKSAKLINTNEPLICDITFFGEIFSHKFSHIYLCSLMVRPSGTPRPRSPPQAQKTTHVISSRTRPEIVGPYRGRLE